MPTRWPNPVQCGPYSFGVLESVDSALIATSSISAAGERFWCTSQCTRSTAVNGAVCANDADPKAAAMREKLMNLVIMICLYIETSSPAFQPDSLRRPPISGLLSYDWYTDHRADNVAGDHEFHTPVLLPSMRCVV